MNDPWKLPSATDVKLDLSQLKGEPAGTDTRYTVALDGPFSQEWIDAFRALQEESAAHRRYELDRTRASVGFSCRTVDGNSLVFEVLERLEDLVERVNQIVAVRRAVSPRISPVSPAPRAR